ncbi:MAG: hypothetical protein DRI94_13320, partial [Bacteroidetes bacterium]
MSVFFQSFSQKAFVISDKYNNLSLESFIESVEKDYDVRFFAESDSIPEIKVSFIGESILLKDLLENLAKENNFYSSIYADNVFITYEKPINIQLLNNSTIVNNHAGEINGNKFIDDNNNFLSDKFVIGKKKESINSTNLTGYISGKEDGSPVLGITFFIEQLQKVIPVSKTGFYNVALKPGTYNIIITANGFEKKNINLTIFSSGKLNIALEKELNSLEEVVIYSDQNSKVNSNKMGVEHLTTAEFNEIPTVLGENDVIKVSLLLPGISSVGEGSSGFNVRGSPTDQNIFYINDVPIYNTAHVFGFFSSFNSDAVSDFTLYKSNIPSEFGGRLASVFDLTAKQGNMKRFSMRGGISPITGRLMFEGPIVKDKGSYLVALRSTYSNWVLNFVKKTDLKNSKINFGDFITNFTFNLNDKNRIKFFTYGSKDDILISNKTNFEFQNLGFSLNWNRIIKNKHSLNVSLINSNYNFSEENTELTVSSYLYNYNISNDEIKTILNIVPAEKHNISVGFDSKLYLNDRGNFLPFGDSSLVQPLYMNKEKALETALFAEEQWKPFHFLTLTGGLRYNYYTYLGPGETYEYETDLAKEESTITDTLSYSNNELIAKYQSPDYRLSAKFLINTEQSVKISYNTMHQYIFMLTNTVAVSPSDSWKLTDSNLKPMSSKQYSIGFYSNFANKMYEISVESYYKDIKKLVEYKDGAELLGNKLPETSIFQGNLDAYGIEFMLKKKEGKLNGWINYTYSKSTVLINNLNPVERINFGEPYPSNFDKPHVFNFTGNYKFTRRFSVSSNVVYSTGRPITYPSSVYYQNGMQVLQYSKRNEYRVPDYFRVDLSIKVEGNLKFKKLAHSSWVISVYNLLGRKNAYSVYYRYEGSKVQSYKLSIFG